MMEKLKEINTYSSQHSELAFILKIMRSPTKPSSKEHIMKFFKVCSTAKCGMHKSIKFNYFEHGTVLRVVNKLVLIKDLVSSSLK